MANKCPLIRIAPSFCILIALSVLLLPLRWIFAWLLAVCVHESGHILAVTICGLRIHAVTVSPVGAKIETENLTPGRRLLCSLAGPAAGLLLILLRKQLPVAALLAFTQSLFNLLPIQGLDGASALYSLLCLTGLPQKAPRVCKWADLGARSVLAACCLLLSWKLSWAAGSLMALLVLLRPKRNPCKRNILRLQ